MASAAAADVRSDRAGLAWATDRSARRARGTTAATASVTDGAPDQLGAGGPHGAGLSLYAGAGILIPIPPASIFAALAAAALILALIGLRTHRIVGLAFRGRFIARREREPVLYWASLILIGLLSAILGFLAILSAGNG